jgi:hypothetical protein
MYSEFGHLAARLIRGKKRVPADGRGTCVGSWDAFIYFPLNKNALLNERLFWYADLLS